MKGLVKVNGLQLAGAHGVLPEEQLTENVFLFSVAVAADFSAAVETDAVEDAISYADIAEIIREENATPSALLEHLAGRIIRRLSESYPQAEKITVSVAKKNPPLSGKMDSMEISLEYIR